MKNCPTCGRPLEVLYFMGITPEYAICPPCGLSWAIDRTTLTAVAGAPGPTIITGETEN